MIAWLYKIIVGSFHRHKWQTAHEYKLRFECNNGEFREGKRIILRCTQCGEVEKRDLIDKL